MDLAGGGEMPDRYLTLWGYNAVALARREAQPLATCLIPVGIRVLAQADHGRAGMAADGLVQESMV